MSAGVRTGQGRTASAAIFSGLAVLAVVGIAVQFLLAGLSVFGAADAWGMHGVSGGVLALPVFGMLWLSLTVSALRHLRREAGVLAGSYLLQVTLAGVGHDYPVVGALHPLNALVMADVTMTLAKTSLARRIA